MMAASERSKNSQGEARCNAADVRAFCDGLDLAALLPAEYAKYSRPVHDALVHFLSGLPSPRIASLMDELGPAGLAAATYQKCVALASTCPTMQKLAQLLARDQRLSPEFRRMLQMLESVTPATPRQDIKDCIERDLGSLATYGIQLAERPIAEGSVAVVVPFKWFDDDSGLCREGVFKVLKPDVERYLGEELELLERVGAHFDANCHEYDLPTVDYEDTFRRVRELLTCEVRIDLERDNLVEARAAYRSNPHVVVPEVFPFYSERLIAMERIRGGKVTELHDASTVDRKKWAAWIVDALMADPIWSNGRLFHADPHAGNLLRTSDGQSLGIVDWSLIGRLRKSEQLALSRLVLGSLMLSPRDVAEAMTSLSTTPVSYESLRPVIEEAFRRLRGGELPGLKWTTRLMDEAVQRTRVQFPSNLLLFRRVFYMLDGVVADVDPDCDIDQVLICSLVRRFLAESPQRFASPPFFHGFATHISNADVMQLFMSTPMTALRYWSGVWGDWFQSSNLPSPVAVDES